MKTFEEIKAKVNALDNFEDNNARKVYNKVLKFLALTYPEVVEYLDDFDEFVLECVEEASSLRECAESIIVGYYIDPTELVELDKDELLKNYLDSKESK